MKVDKIRKLAKGLGIKGSKLKKTDLVRTIQRHEGNVDCFRTKRAAGCSEIGCLWRKDCIEVPKDKGRKKK